MGTENKYDRPTPNRLLDRMRRNPLLTWVSDMVQILAGDQIKVPSDYRLQVLETKNLLTIDISGFVNTILDFAIDSALVDFYIEVPNKNLEKKLNLWLQTINLDLEVPSGIKALAKEYFRERWKGSSFLLLRSFWGTKEGYNLPKTLYFVDGEDIIVADGYKKKVTLENKKYILRIGDDEKDWKNLPYKQNEIIFIQKPYTAWGTNYPVPFLIQRGIYKNLKFLELLEKKGEFIVGKALEYLMLFKKGSEAMTLTNNPDFIYSKDDLQKIKDDMANLASQRKTGSGITSYITGHDTEIEHLIPDYIRGLRQELYTPIERRILGGLGLIEIVRGLSSTRRESILNPKPFFAEIKTGIEDFKALLLDVISTMVDKNLKLHRKYFRNEIKIRTNVVKEELTDDVLTMLRSAYDRGILSKRTFAEILGFNLDIEIDRRKDEEKHQEVLYPPIIQNLEQHPDELKEKKEIEEIKNENIPDDKKGPEKINYTKAKDHEEIFYKTNQDLPEEVQGLPSGAKTIWRKAFNSAYSKYEEDSARKIAWHTVKLTYIKNKDGKWIRKSKGEFEEGAKTDFSIEELIEIKKLEVLGKKNKIIDKILDLNKEENE